MEPLYDAPMLVRAHAPGGLLRANRAFLERTGLERATLAARELLEWIHPDDRADLVDCLQRGAGRVRARHATRSEAWLALEWQVRSHDGESVAFAREPRVGGAPPSAAHVPPRHATMSDTLDAMARIVESKNPGMRCSILLVDPAREYIIGGAGPSLPDAYNRAVEGLRLGPSVGSCGTAAFWNEPVVVEDIGRDPLWEHLRGAAALAGVSACWSQPVTSMSGDVLGAMALYADAPGRPTQHQMEGLEIAARMVGLAVERDRLEAQLERASRMEAIGVLAGGVAHDFNNLLAVVMGNAELALAVLPDDGPAGPMLREIVTASLSAGELCNQLLAYAGRGALTAEALDVNALMRELGGLLQVALSKKTHLDWALHGEPLGVLADRSQLRQVVMNLITNAAEAIGEAPGAIELGSTVRHVSAAELARRFPDAGLAGGDYAVLWVRDTGAGMDAATQARIFDPFFTTKAGGRGLGLAAVQGIVRGHRGAIELESAPDAGTVFTVWLPRVAAPAAAGAEPASGAVEPGECVLVVDDELNVRRTVARSLAAAGYRVLEAGDGIEALEVVRREGERVHCVLLDLSMPRMGGEETFRELRRLRRDLPVILSSGFAEKELLERFEGEGLAGVVQKPTPRAVLLAKLAAALAAREGVAE
ncbi:MAG: response regulator [Planctomycetes bacterium]|nr:response regulator [Planctomycetota bacterium]